MKNELREPARKNAGVCAITMNGFQIVGRITDTNEPVAVTNVSGSRKMINVNAVSTAELLKG